MTTREVHKRMQETASYDNFFYTIGVDQLAQLLQIDRSDLARHLQVLHAMDMVSFRLLSDDIIILTESGMMANLG